METSKIIEILGLFIRKYIVENIENISPKEVYEQVKKEYYGKYMTKNEVDDILNFLHNSSKLATVKLTDGSFYYKLSDLLSAKEY